MELADQQPEKPGGKPSDKNAARIQNAISVLAVMEKQLDDLSAEVADMKRKLQLYAETEADLAKAEILDSARREADEKLNSVRASAREEADKIIQRGNSDTERLRSKVSGSLPSAVDLIVKTVLSTD